MEQNGLTKAMQVCHRYELSFDGMGWSLVTQLVKLKNGLVMRKIQYLYNNQGRHDHSSKFAQISSNQPNQIIQHSYKFLIKVDQVVSFNSFFHGRGPKDLRVRNDNLPYKQKEFQSFAAKT